MPAGLPDWTQTDLAPRTVKSVRNFRDWARFAVVALLSAVLLGGGLTFFTPAEPTRALNNGTWGVDSTVTVNGNFTMAGNGVVRCDQAMTNTAYYWVGSSYYNGNCTQLHTGGSGTYNNNDTAFMTNADVVSGMAGPNSSSATVTIPTGAKVVKAMLYWSGTTGVVQGVSSPMCGMGVTDSFGRYPTAKLPTNTTGYRTQAVQLRVPGNAGDVTVSPSFVAWEELTQLGANDAQYYSAQADVSQYFANMPSGSQTISVGDIWAANGFNCYAGWSIALVYDYGKFDPANAVDSQARMVTIYDGHKRIISGGGLSVPFDFPPVLGLGSRIGMTMYEGDLNIKGDTGRYSVNRGGTWTELPNIDGAYGNIGVSRADGAINMTGVAAARTYNASVDVSTKDLPLAAGLTHADIYFGTTGDNYLVQNAILATPVSQIAIEKTMANGQETGYVVVGEVPQFKITVTNPGSTTLDNIVVTDPLAPSCARTIGTLAPGASTSYTCAGPAYTGTPYTNVATAKGNTRGFTDNLVTTDTSDVQTSAVRLDKSVALKSGVPGFAGDVLKYTFKVTNTGQSKLADVRLSDPLPGLSAMTAGSWPDPSKPGVLAPGQSVTYTATYTKTQADVDRGYVRNTATVSAADSDGGSRATDTSTAERQVPDTTDIALDKQGSHAIGSNQRVGDTVNYTFYVTNNGGVTLNDVKLSDPLPGLSTPVAGAWPDPAKPGTLLPNQTVKYTATYKLTQADLDRGYISNVATANATGVRGKAVSAVDDNTLPVAQNLAISLNKTGAFATNGSTVAGDRINYKFLVTNTGATTLTNVKVNDPLVPTITCTGWPGTVGTLAPGQQVSCTGSYAITQADIAKGKIDNKATATGANGTQTATATDTWSERAIWSPGLTLDKTGKFAGTLPQGAGHVPGDKITYNFAVSNIGNTPLNNVTVTDPLKGLSAVTCQWPGAQGSIPVGGKVNCTASYSLTQADINAGVVENQATANGVNAYDNSPVYSSDTNSIPVEQVSGIDLQKAVTPTSVKSLAEAQPLTYTFTIKNTGNTMLQNVTLKDQLEGLSGFTYAWPDPAKPGVLNAGQTVTVKATLAMSQEQYNYGEVKNTATVTATDPLGVEQTDTASATVTTARTSDFKVTKVASQPKYSKVGEVITYTFTLENTGNVTLDTVSLKDPMPGLSELSYDWSGAVQPNVLLPGQKVTATATYAITQADLDKQPNQTTGHTEITNTVTGSARSEVSGTQTKTASATITADPVRTIALDKQGNLNLGADGVASAGDTVTYSFVVTNTGTTTLDNVRVQDPLPGLSNITFGAWPNPAAPGSLVPGASVTATASYTLTQADVDAGSVMNTATATGTSKDGVSVTAQDPNTVSYERNTGISLTKTGSFLPDQGDTVGDVATFTLEATNTGPVTLTGVTITDQLPGTSAVSYSWPGAAGVLQPGQTVTATVTYPITQADLNAGKVVNPATASGTPPQGLTPPSADTVFELPTVERPAIDVEKDGTVVPGADGVVNAGDTVNYTFDLTNTGNVPLNGVALSDKLPQLSNVTFPEGFTQTLAPGETVRATASYILTQGDIDAGSVANTATAEGISPSSTKVTDVDPNTETFQGSTNITLDKTATYVVGDGSKIGDRIEYTFTVTNTGSTTLTSVHVTDTKKDLSQLTMTWPGEPGVLAPGETATGVASYTVTQVDIDAGSIVNNATATGTPPAGLTPPVAEDSVTMPVQANADLSFDKSAQLYPPEGEVADGVVLAGDTARYTFLVRNNGNVTLHDPTVTDPLLGGEVPIPADVEWPDPSQPGVLPPGGAITFEQDYILTQEDVDRQFLDNTATATALDPNNQVLTREDSVHIEYAAFGSIGLWKNGTYESETGGAKPGDVINYALMAVNNGNLVLNDVTITDPMLGGTVDLTDAAWANPATPGTLAPGEFVTVLVDYRLTQEDIDRGVVNNLATTRGLTPNGDEATAVASETLQTNPEPALTVTKDFVNIDLGADGVPSVGDTVNWSVSKTNSGNTTLFGVNGTDSIPDFVKSDVQWPDPTAPGVLKPGETARATGQTFLTQAQIDAGTVHNVYTVTAHTESDQQVSDSDDADAPMDAKPGLAVKKTGTAVDPGADGHQVGDTVTFSFEVTNTGQTSLTNVALDDQLPGLSTPVITWPNPAEPQTLRPGQTATAIATYQLTQQDITAGKVHNAVTATATPPSGEVPPATTEVDVPVTQAPAITLDKLGVLDAGADTTPNAGDVVKYRFTVENTGNVPLTQVGVQDALPGLSNITVDPNASWPGAEGTLEVGQSVSFIADYTLTQSDIDAGAVMNTATTSGISPQNVSVTDEDPETVRYEAAPALTLEKDGAFDGAAEDPLAGSHVGDTVSYSFVITNTGAVTLTNVALDDTLDGLSTVTFTWPGAPNQLAPGESARGTASYKVTQADLDRGEIVNTATATGVPPTGTPPEATDTHTLDVPERATIALEKNASYVETRDPDTDNRIHTANYSFVITNTGNVPLTNVTLNDPLLDPASVNITWPDATQPGVLLAGQQATATASYAIPQSVVTDGTLTNQATVQGTSPSGATPNASDDATLEIPESPEIEVTKIGTPPSDLDGDFRAEAGDTISYTFVIGNTGNVPLNVIDVNDHIEIENLQYTDWPGHAPNTAFDPAAENLIQPGEYVELSAVYTLTQADIDRGYLDNQVNVRGTSPRGTEVSDSDTWHSEYTVTADISVDKEGALSVGNGSQPGDTVSYSFLVTNTGNTTLTGVYISDPLIDANLIPLDLSTQPVPGELAPGAQAKITRDYKITALDIERGYIDNSVIASGLPVTPGVDRPLGFDSEHVVLSPAITIDKAGTFNAGADGRASAGDVIDYVFTVTNTGELPLSDAKVTDPLIDGDPATPGVQPWTVDVGDLAVAETKTVTAQYTLTQADVDAGSVANTATADAAVVGAPAGAPRVSDTDPALVGYEQQPSLIVQKDGAVTTDNGAPGASAGDVITYTFTVTNTGNVTIDNVVINDPMPGLSTNSMPIGTLAPGTQGSATAQYTLTQADIDAGLKVNVATATGTGPTPTPTPGQTTPNTPVPIPTTQNPTNTPTATNTIPFEQAPAIQIEKSHAAPRDTDGDGRVSAGDIVDFSFLVTNSGNVTLTNIEVTDPTTNPTSLRVGTLKPGEAETVRATHTLTQADIDAGAIANLATVTGATPDGGTVTDKDPDVVNYEQQPGLKVYKSGRYTEGDGSKVGDVITYFFNVENTGTVTMTNVTVTDPMPGLSSNTMSVGVLKPGEAKTVFATYTITQADLDKGMVINEATVTGDTPTPSVYPSPTPGQTDIPTATPGVPLVPPTSSATATTPTKQTPAIDVQKSHAAPADTNGDGKVSAGDVVTFDFQVSNTGNVPLTGVTVSDPLTAPSSITVGDLAPGEVKTVSAEYTLTQGDLDAGAIQNVATVTGADPKGGTVTDKDPDVVSYDQLPGLRVVKSGAYTQGDGSKVGDVITFEFTVTNTGNVTATNVTVSDPMPGLSAIPVIPSLAPGQSETVTATYALTQADLDEGMVVNVATVTGDSPTPTHYPTPTPGQSEPAQPTPGNPVPVPTTPDASNTPTATATVPVKQLPAIQIDKSHAAPADTNGDGKVSAGDVITFSFQVSNTGNVPLTGVTVSDPMTAPSSIVVGDLKPGEVKTVSADYTLTQADLDAGAIANIATVTGTGTNGTTVTDKDPDVVSYEQQPGLRVVKNGAYTQGDGSKVGDVITFEFTVTNTGNVTATNVTVSDPMPGLSAIPVIPSLAPGQSETVTATYALTQADLDEGMVVNVATVTGDSPTPTHYPTPTPGQSEPAQPTPGNPVPVPTTPDASNTPTATATVPVKQLPAIQIDKSHAAPADTNGDGKVSAGDVITFSFQVSNTGNVPLTGVTVSDPMTAPSSIVVGDLKPGEVKTVSADYTLTQADLDAGAIQNVATVTAATPNGDTVTDKDPDVVTYDQQPGLRVVKDGSYSKGDGSKVGDIITFTFTVTNTGNVTMTNVTVNDTMPGLGAIPEVGTLAPGETKQVSTSYMLTQADLDRGLVINVATVTGDSPTPTVYPTPTPGQTEPSKPTPGNPVPVPTTPNATNTPTASATVPVTQAPAITIDKSHAAPIDTNGDGILSAGDTIRFTFTVTNTGNVMLTNVVVTDPMTDPSSITVDTLGSTEARTVEADYVLTQADLEAGSVQNLAKVTGDDPKGGKVTNEDPDTVPLPPAPAIEIVKDARVQDGTADVAGDVIEYTFTVTNTGNKTLTDIVVSDPMPGLSEIQVDWSTVVVEGELTPGEHIVCHATYTVTAEDVARGTVHNAATVTGTPKTGSTTPVSDDDDADVSVMPTPTPTPSPTPVPVTPAPTPEKPGNPLVGTGADGLTASFAAAFGMLVLGLGLTAWTRRRKENHS